MISEKKQSNKVLLSIIRLLIISNLVTAYFVTKTSTSLGYLKSDLQSQSMKLSDKERELHAQTRILTKYKNKINELNADNEELDRRLADLQAQFVAEDEQTSTDNPVEAVSQKPSNKELKTKNTNAFTVGSTKDEVRAVMGNPETVLRDSWWYGGQAWIRFDEQGLVMEWDDGNDMLKTE
ncbi:hypothetical protein SAMN05428981_1108 [Bacillus sp. OV194]|nr:hypothetical protein SAMN05428981_1108 [Bacillus sp. OV194]